jgi:hypothetical protein
MSWFAMLMLAAAVFGLLWGAVEVIDRWGGVA